MEPRRRSMGGLRCAIVALLAAAIGPRFCQGQSNFFFGHPENRFVPSFQSGVQQSSGSYFDQGANVRYNNQPQFRPNVPDYAQRQAYNSQNDAGFPDVRFTSAKQPPQPPQQQTSSQYFEFAPVVQGRPTSFQVNNNNRPLSTAVPQFHHHFAPTSHNHDPSKPETFLGQITINNPEPFPENPRNFGGVLRTSINNLDYQSAGFPSVADPVDQELLDISEKIKPSTYNPLRSDFSRLRPNKLYGSKQDDVDSLQRKPFGVSNENYFNSNENNFSNGRNRFRPKPSSTTTAPPQTERKNRFSPSTKTPTKGLAFNVRPSKANFSPNRPHYSTTTEHKSLFDLEPLLEDEIPGSKFFGDSLRSNSNGSEDVEVIKSADTTTGRPAVTTSGDRIAVSTISPVENVSKNISKAAIEDITTEPYSHDELTTEYPTSNDQEAGPSSDSTHTSSESSGDHHDNSEPTEYYDEETDYVEETDGGTQQKPADHENDDENAEYEDFEESESPVEEEAVTTMGETFDILTMKPKPLMVKDENFKGFVDSGLIDNTEPPSYVTEHYLKPDKESGKTTEKEKITTDPPSILLGEEVVSVVTTKSVINGTYKVPESVSSSTQMTSEEVETSTASKALLDESAKHRVPNATESWVVVASVQTSRSVSGARFLPFPSIAQEEKKQALSDLEELKDDATSPKPTEDLEESTEDYTTESMQKASSTESIIDKLDRVQSELSIGFLSGRYKDGNQDFAVLTEMPHENMTKEVITTSPPPQVFTVKSTISTSTTERATPEPLPVTIKKFSPYARPVTTSPKPKTKPTLYTIKVDDLDGLLPPGFRPSFRDRKITTTTEKIQIKESDKSFKNKIVFQEDISALLPKGYTPPTKTEKPLSIDDLLKNAKDISHLLPPGFKQTAEEKPATSTEKPKDAKSKLLTKAEPVDISAFLPKGYKPEPVTEKASQNNQSTLLGGAKPVDISAFLPPGFKLSDAGKSNKGDEIEKEDAGKKTTANAAENPATPKPSSNGFKVVFPSRPGAGKPGKRLTTPKPSHEGGGGVGSGGGVSVPSIQKGWPTRATTEFTGWPSPSTTPFSIDKIIEAQRAATATTSEESAVELSTSGPTKTTTSAPTTTTTSAPTTPGTCTTECDLAATIKIVGGVKWVPELLDHNTKEWQLLANEVSKELNAAYSKSPKLKKWYKGIRIDGFSKGSVLVDYFVELNEIAEKIDTSELKKLFHTSLNDARPGTVVEEVVREQPDKITGRKIDDFDVNVMVGDQPPEDRLIGKAEPIREKIDLSKGKLEIGKFVLDPIFTEFIVLPKRIDPTIGYAEDNMLLPQWGIAVIVIALASLLFVVIFGVTVLVNRQKSAKAKQPIPLSEDMLRELDKSHMGGVTDDLYMHDQEPPYPPRNHKRGSTAMLDPFAYPGNPGDSWRSEWGPYYNQYQQQQQQQHYAPDSGRGSQSYTGGNNYGYTGSQLYGYNGGGSQNYGYTGEGVRTLYPRRRSDFDSNF